jgi:limonene-1,2-epoxide hydrolase
MEVSVHRSTASPLETIRTFMETIGRKDYDAASAFIAEDCEYTNIPLGTVRGPAGVRSVLEPFFAPTLENEFVWKHSATDGALVFVERVDRHRLQDRWVELPVTGLFRVDDGRITLWRDYFDAQTILGQWPKATEA